MKIATLLSLLVLAGCSSPGIVPQSTRGVPVRTGPTWSGCGIPVYGFPLVTPAETNTAEVAEWLTRLYEGFPMIRFWRSLDRVELWNPARLDAPPEMKQTHPDAAGNYRVAAGLFYPGDRHIALNIDLMTLPVLAHECGHLFLDRNVEGMASAVGAVVMYEARIPGGASPAPGLSRLMAAQLTP